MLVFYFLIIVEIIIKLNDNFKTRSKLILINGHHVGFVLVVGRIQPMLELFETGSILGVILIPLFTM